MTWRACAVALCALAVARAAAYTVDCNHEYTDCETELSKLAVEDEEPQPSTASPPDPTTKPSTLPPFLPTIIPEEPSTDKKDLEATTKATDTSEATESSKQPRLLNLNVDELQNFANALHNDSSKNKGQKVDLSDVNMDDDEEDDRRMTPDNDKHHHDKQIPDKFYTNLQVPFHPLLTMDRASEEMDTCKDNDVAYKIGDRIERGCEEVCECSPGGSFDCTPRCKHPYIRRGRRLTDPLCFESPVDECCSIVACATGNQDNIKQVAKADVCRYSNETHQVGEKWHIGCEQTCACEANSVVTCRPRCKKLTPSDKCINVQDPQDECCEVQVCDVSQDAHEEPDNATSSTTTTTTTTESIKGFEDYSDLLHQAPELVKPLLGPIGSINHEHLPQTTPPTEPIGSVKVLQNNSVQVNLMHMNSSEDPIFLLLSSDGGKNFDDVELKYSNLILNLPQGKDYVLKTKETGTKFNFTITAALDQVEGERRSNNMTIDLQNAKIGCYQDGQFYAVGEEFHIGCTELCECTGPNQRECAELVCPSHVGLELMSKGCVRWAPSPPAQPPNCCPRAARCLSDGTCHYKGVAIPNWSEVPISLTGCEQNCFCENGELECQEVCSPLPALPPQSLRCPPLHRPAPLNISDDDCCKQWGCVPNAQEINATDLHNYAPIIPFSNYESPDSQPAPNPPPLTADPTDFFRHLHPVKFPFPKNYEMPKYSIVTPKMFPAPIENISIFTLEDIPTENVQPIVVHPNVVWAERPKIPDTLMDFKSPKEKYIYPKLPPFPISDAAMHDLIKPPSERLLNLNKNFNHAKETTKFFLPAESDGVEQELLTNAAPLIKQNLFTPAENRSIYKYSEPHKKIQNYIYKSAIQKYPEYKTQSKQNSLTQAAVSKQLKSKAWKNNLLKGFIPPVLTKAPNPYETVLLRPVTAAKTTKVSRVYNSPLNLDQLVSQMEVESEVNRNLGRSAHNADTTEGQSLPAPDLSNPQPPFLPTIRPEIHFPTEDTLDNRQQEPDLPGLHPGLPPGLPPGFPQPPNYPDENKKLTVLSILADSPTSVKLLFGLPPVLVGLRGSVDLRYTDKADEDIAHWYSQVFAPADEVLTTPRLEFRLTGLRPATAYRIKGKLFLHNLPVEPESPVYTVRTLDLPSVTPIPVEEKRKEIDGRLTVVDVNVTAAHVSWRHFTDDELRFIDGVQIRYRPVGTPIYSMTEILHHSRSLAELAELRPGTRYEAALVLVPPPRAAAELYDPAVVEFTTEPFVDPYNWSVTVSARAVGAEAVELSWRGVPAPAERWVRVYRAAHACGASRHEHDAFRLAARDLPPTLLLKGLEPDTRCRVWMELFLTNGKIKTSNVLEINTKSEDSPEDIDNEIEAASVADSRGGDSRGDYYGALVVVGVVAALGALTSLLLLLVLVRRHRPRSVPITPVPSAPRDSSLPPYDNPAYKLELQQETMDL